VQTGQLTIVRTDPATQLIAAAAQNVALTVNMVQGSGIGQVDGSVAGGNTVKSRVRAITILSVQNLAWEVILWGKDTYNTGAIEAQFPLGQWAFATGDGTQIAGTGLYLYHVDGLDIPYVDLDASGEVHLMLVNRSAGAKSADAAGAILVQLQLEPCLGY
jgi:hypothetical protein